MTLSNINRLLDQLFQQLYMSRIRKDYEEYMFDSIIKECEQLLQSHNLKFQMGFLGKVGKLFTKGTALLHKATKAANKVVDHGNKIINKGSKMMEKTSKMIENTSKAVNKAVDHGNKIINKGSKMIENTSKAVNTAMDHGNKIVNEVTENVKETHQKLQFAFPNPDDKKMIRQIINKHIMISQYCKNDTNILLMFFFAILLLQYDNEIETYNETDLTIFVKKNINTIEIYNKIENIIVNDISIDKMKKQIQQKLCSCMIKVLQKE